MPRLGGMYGPDVTFVEVDPSPSPVYDSAESTSFFANHVVLEMLSGIAFLRRGGPWDSIPRTLLEGR